MSAGTYWSVVGGQLRKNRVAMVAWRLVLAVLVVAVAAPLLAFNVPIVEWGRAGLSFPLLDVLFDRFLFPGGVEVFFNLLLVCLPAWWLAGHLARRRAAARADEPVRRFAPVLGPLAVAWTLVTVVAAATGAGYLGAVLAFVVLPGAAAVAWGRLGSAPFLRRHPNAGALAAAGIFIVAFAAVMTLPTFRTTRTVLDHRVRVAALSAAGEGSAVFPLAPFHPDNVGEQGTTSISRSLQRPGGENVLGCDINGRDVFSRLVFGTRISMSIGLVAVSIYIAIGVFLGSLAGYYGRKVDLLISRLVEVMICIPSIFLILTIIAIFESRSIFLIMLVIGLVGWPGIARLVRGEFLRQRGLDYVTAARAQAIPERRVIFGHVLPNCMGPVLVSATLGIAAAILTESGLAFLGLGDPSAASWGEMLTSGRVTGKWHLILVPGGAIFFVVTVFNLLGEGLRDALDPKLRR